MAGRIEEDNGTQREERDKEIIVQPEAHALKEEVTDEGGTDDELHPHQIERYDILREEQEGQSGSCGVAQHVERLLLVVAVHIHHGRAEYLYEQQHHKLAHGGGRIEEQHRLIAYAHHKIDDHGHTGEEDAARHALAVEHQEEREVDQCRPRLLLQHDEEHGHEHNAAGHGKILHPVDVEAEGAHKLADGQRRGEFGKLRRLHPKRSEHNPRPGALDLHRIEDGGEEQEEQESVDDIGKAVVVAVVEQQDDESEHKRRPYPHYLHAGPGGEAEDIRLLVGVAGTAHAEPSEDQQCHIDADGPPVERAQHTGLLICLLCHI